MAVVAQCGSSRDHTLGYIPVSVIEKINLLLAVDSCV